MFKKHNDFQYIHFPQRTCIAITCINYYSIRKDSFLSLYRSQYQEINEKRNHVHKTLDWISWSWNIKHSLSCLISYIQDETQFRRIRVCNKLKRHVLSKKKRLRNRSREDFYFLRFPRSFFSWYFWSTICFGSSLRANISKLKTKTDMFLCDFDTKSSVFCTLWRGFTGLAWVPLISN